MLSLPRGLEESILDLLDIGSGLGHSLEILAEKIPLALDYFQGRFTFKAVP